MKTIHANNLEFSYLTFGEGPLMICLHGFPDSAYTWDILGPKLAELGYQVVAPFMRGYYPTEIPATKSYSALELGQDVVALINELGADSAVVLGHDWGALAAYSAANLEASAVSKLITLAIPHPRSLKPSVSGLWKARHFITFQFRNSARRTIARNDFSGVDKIYKRWSPTWDFEASETEYIKNSFKTKERLDAALGYYWSFREDSFGDQSKNVRKIINAKTTVPTLCLVGGADGALDLSQMENTKTCFTDEYSYQIIQGVGHFLHREAPDEVFRQISTFLGEM
ncbi:MAG: alpha/beta hydrolase [Chloroflexota bacterium]